MKMGRRKKMIGGLALAVFSTFLLVQTGWAIHSPFSTDVIPPSGSDLHNPKSSEAVGRGAGSQTTTTTGGEGSTQPGTNDNHNPFLIIVTKVFFEKLAVIGNLLVVLRTRTEQTVQNLQTRETTVTNTITDNAYDSLGRQKSQKSSSNSETVGPDGTKTTSSTSFVFEYNSALGGFVAVRQITKSTTINPGKDSASRMDDTVTRQTTTIERTHDRNTGKLTSAQGFITGRTDNVQERSTFSGELKFDICAAVNQECLKEQVTDTTTFNKIDKQSTASHTVLSQAVDAFARLISGQAITDSTTVSTDRSILDKVKSITHSVTNFLPGDGNNLTAYATDSTTETFDRTELGQREGYSISRQVVIIQNEGVDVAFERNADGEIVNVTATRTGEISGKVNGADGELYGRSVNVPDGWDGVTPPNPDTATVRSFTTGFLDFQVINNNIVNNSSDITVDNFDDANGIESHTTQNIRQNYDQDTGLGIDGTITSRSSTITLGVLEKEGEDADGDGQTTRYDPVTGQWTYDRDNRATEGGALGTVSETVTQIRQVYAGFGFVNSDILSVTVSGEYFNPNDKTSLSNVSTNVTYTKQDYRLDGTLMPPQLDDHHEGGGRDYRHDTTNVTIVESFSMPTVNNLGAEDKNFLIGLTPQALMNYYSDGNGRIRADLIGDQGHPRGRNDILMRF